MALSLMLLAGFVGYWLYTQYEGEKDQLKKDIAREFEATQREVTDTLIFVKLKHEFFDSNRVLSGKNIISRKVNNGGPEFAMTIGEADSSLIASVNQIKELSKHADVRKITTNRRTKITFVSNDSSRESKPPLMLKRNYDGKVDSHFTDIILAQGMKMIVSEIINIVGDTIGNDLLNVDTNLIKRTFDRRLQKNGYSLDVNFVADYDKYKLNKKPGEIYVDEEFFGNTYGVAVSNYRTQLFKGITPQMFFSLFLLALTVAAFLFTYRSLKDQIKLGVIKNDFISNMSHELKTPIATVKVAIEALTNYNMVEDPVKTREYLGMAAIEMDRLEMLVSQALNASLIEGGRITLRKEQQDMQRIVEEVCKAMHLRFEQHNAKVNIDVSGADFVTAVDKLHMQGVLINLLDNSLKYADKKPGIDISLSKTAGDIKITIADNGPGIPKEYIDKVFDKFFRVPTGDSHNVKGFGLGLSYSQQIMAQHGGSINVYNKPEGGCVFILILPKIN